MEWAFKPMTDVPMRSQACAGRNTVGRTPSDDGDIEIGVRQL